MCVHEIKGAYFGFFDAIIYIYTHTHTYICIYIAVKVYEVSVKYIYIFVCMYVYMCVYMYVCMKIKLNVQNVAYKRMLENPFSTRVLENSNLVFFIILFLPDFHRDNISIPLSCLKFLEAIMQH